MATVKNKNTQPEILVRKALFKRGFRYRINNKKLPGSPDIVLPKYNSVIFIHGCFWHGHSNCKKAIKPKSNIAFWQSKRLKNKERDNKVKRKLKKAGWIVFTIWECELRNKETFNKSLNKLLAGLRNSPPQQPHTFAIPLNANSQTQKLQKNVAALQKKAPLKKQNIFGLWYKNNVIAGGQEICPTVYNKVQKTQG